LTKIFDPLTREKAGGKSRLLICDGHESHVSGRFAAYCFQHNIVLFLLVPHSSHLLQPLDIGVFGPLKKAVSASLEKLIRVGVNRLEKAEWVDKYAEGRVHALTKSNIQGGWRGAGLVPLCRQRVIRFLPEVILKSAASELPESSTPPPETPFDPAILQSSSLDPAALHSLSNKLCALAIKDELNTPARNFIPHLTQGYEESIADNIILKRQLADTLETLGARQVRKQGKRAILKGVYNLYTKELVESLVECDEAAKKKKASKGRGKKKSGKKAVQEAEDASEDEDEEV
jgi:hypothetical protein